VRGSSTNRIAVVGDTPHGAEHALELVALPQERRNHHQHWQRDGVGVTSVGTDVEDALERTVHEQEGIVGAVDDESHTTATANESGDEGVCVCTSTR